MAFHLIFNKRIYVLPSLVHVSTRSANTPHGQPILNSYYTENGWVLLQRNVQVTIICQSTAATDNPRSTNSSVLFDKQKVSIVVWYMGEGMWKYGPPSPRVRSTHNVFILWREMCIPFLAIAITPHKIPNISSPNSKNSFSKGLGMRQDISDFDFEEAVPDEPVEFQP